MKQKAKKVRKLKLGKRFQKKINKKYMKIILSGLAMMILLVFYHSLRQRVFMDTERLQIDLLNEKRFISVERPNDYENDSKLYKVSFDLKTKEFYSLNYAVRSKKTYGQNRWTAKEIYVSWINKTITPILLNLKVSKKKILESNYVIELEPDLLLDKEKLENPKSGDIESYFVYFKMSKVRITYNKEFLPIKLEGYYEKNGKMSWSVLRVYSYPFKSKEEFDNEMDKAIENIQEHEAEVERN